MAKRVHIPDSEYMAGLDAVADSINRELQQMENGSIKGLQRAATRVMKNAVKRAPVYVPGVSKGSSKREGGDLRRSGTIKDPISDGDVVSVEMGFYVPYAANQHEHTEYEHPGGGEAKYLENALLDERDNILKLVAEGMLHE